MPRRYAAKPSRSRPQHATWILAADAGRARLFEAPAPGGSLKEIADLINADARLHRLQIVSDRTGHMNRSDGAGTAFEPRQWPVEHAAEAFAKTLCRRLRDGRRSGVVDRIYLVADPAFLGLLRKNLDRATQRIVACEAAKDVTRRPVGQIRKQLLRDLADRS